MDRYSLLVVVGVDVGIFVTKLMNHTALLNPVLYGSIDILTNKDTFFAPQDHADGLVEQRICESIHKELVGTKLGHKADPGRHQCPVLLV